MRHNELTNTIDNRVPQFIEAAERAGAKITAVHRDAEKISAFVQKIISRDKTGILAEPDVLDHALFASVKSLPNVVINPTDNELETTWFGITDAFAGIIRTGSVCVAVSDGLGSSASLFTRSHIVILDSSDLYSRPGNLLQSEKIISAGFLQNMVFVTGPSATADMGELVRGVHGPGELHILLLV